MADRFSQLAPSVSEALGRLARGIMAGSTNPSRLRVRQCFKQLLLSVDSSSQSSFISLHWTPEVDIVRVKIAPLPKTDSIINNFVDGCRSEVRSTIVSSQAG
jgi:hypothetical protein